MSDWKEVENPGTGKRPRYVYEIKGIHPKSREELSSYQTGYTEEEARQSYRESTYGIFTIVRVTMITRV